MTYSSSISVATNPPNAALYQLQGLDFQGLPPETHMRIEVRHQDAAGWDWGASFAGQTDAEGQLTMGAVKGAGEAADSLTWLWNLQPIAGEAALIEAVQRGTLIGLAPALETPLSPLELDLTVLLDGDAIFASPLSLPRCPKSVRAETIQHQKLRGQWFRPIDQAVRGAVLVLGGSEGGIVPARAAALAAEGYAALALGYFDYEDRPKAASNLPLDYFEAALAWMGEQVPGEKRFVWGGSRGSEAALLSAVHFSALVDGVIGWVPGPLVHTGFDMVGGTDFAVIEDPMWTLKGVPVPGAPHLPVTAARQSARERAYSSMPGYRYTAEFRDLWATPGLGKPYGIPIEQVKAPVLLVGAEDDGIWPSAEGAEILLARHQQRGGEATVEAIILPKAGHALGMPNEPRPYSHVAYWQGGYSGVEGGFIDQGGTPETNAKAARDGWAAALRFLGCDAV